MPRKKQTLTKEYYEAFPDRLRGLMKKYGKTQQDIADEIGKSRQAISFYTDGQSSPDWKTIVKIARCFNVSTDYLLGLTDVESTNPDIGALVMSLGFDEQAASALIALTSIESAAPMCMLNSLLLLSPELIEKLSDRFLMYVLLKHLDIASSVKDQVGTDSERDAIQDIQIRLNGFKLPRVPADDLLDYSRFELSRSIVDAADFTFTSGNYKALIEHCETSLKTGG